MWEISSDRDASVECGRALGFSGGVVPREHRSVIALKSGSDHRWCPAREQFRVGLVCEKMCAVAVRESQCVDGCRDGLLSRQRKSRMPRAISEEILNRVRSSQPTRVLRGCRSTP